MVAGEAVPRLPGLFVGENVSQQYALSVRRSYC
jgi:hypothetical protein